MNLQNRASTPEDANRSGDTAEMYRRFIASVVDYAIYGLDTSGNVLSWNPGAQRMKGYTAEEIVGRHFSVFFTPEEVAAGKPAHELEVAARDGRFEDEDWRVRKDGSRFWANVVLSAVRNEQGEVTGFAKVTRDLTARREAEEQARRLAVEAAARAEVQRRSEELQRLNEQLEAQAVELELQEEESRTLAEHLQQANEELEAALHDAREARNAAERAAAAATEANRELDQFAYMASHDLRAPLRAIANLAQWIRDDVGEALDSTSQQHLRLLQAGVHRMEGLIDGILAYSRAGRTLNAPEPVDTGALVREVVELLAPPAEVTIQVADAMPTVEAERVPLQQVFLNLIGNALKYSLAVRPDVVIRIGWRDLGDTVEFTVSDNGPGIAPEFHDRIWGMFQTLAARDKVEGTGIGLSVVKKIAETRGGAVSVESALHQGATFRFTWPKTPHRQGAANA